MVVHSYLLSSFLSTAHTICMWKLSGFTPVKTCDECWVILLSTSASVHLLLSFRLLVMRMHNLHGTEKEKEGEESSDEESDEEEDEDKKPQMELAMMPHYGAINRVRVCWRSCKENTITTLLSFSFLLNDFCSLVPRWPGVGSSRWPPSGQRKDRLKYLTSDLSWRPSTALLPWLLSSNNRRKPRPSSASQDIWRRASLLIGRLQYLVRDIYRQKHLYMCWPYCCSANLAVHTWGDYSILCTVIVNMSLGLPHSEWIIWWEQSVLSARCNFLPHPFLPQTPHRLLCTLPDCSLFSSETNKSHSFPQPPVCLLFSSKTADQQNSYVQAILDLETSLDCRFQAHIKSFTWLNSPLNLIENLVILLNVKQAERIKVIREEGGKKKVIVCIAT